MRSRIFPPPAPVLSIRHPLPSSAAVSCCHQPPSRKHQTRLEGDCGGLRTSTIGRTGWRQPAIPTSSLLRTTICLTGSAAQGHPHRHRWSRGGGRMTTTTMTTTTKAPSDWAAPPSPPLMLHSLVLSGWGLQHDAPQPLVAPDACRVLCPDGDRTPAHWANARHDAVL
jgi:hypothetical protein